MVALSPSCEMEKHLVRPRVVIHGGAGAITRKNLPRHRGINISPLSYKSCTRPMT